MLNARVRPVQPKRCSSCSGVLLFVPERTQFFCPRCRLYTVVIGPGGEKVGRGTNIEITVEELMKTREIFAAGKGVPAGKAKPFVLRLVRRPREKNETKTRNS